MAKPRQKTACVVVLGDLGRSPRMRNHALSLAEEDYRVTLIGFGDVGTRLPQSIAEHPNIGVTHMTPFPSILAAALPSLLNYVLKPIWQSIVLWLSLPLLWGPDIVLLQNPPTIPCMPVCYLYCLLRPRTKLVIDWHNYGYTILAMAFGQGYKHPLTRLAHAIETNFGPRADAAFCVTEAMRRDLASEKWNGTKATTLYDRAPDRFKPISIRERHELFMRLGQKYPVFLGEKAESGSTTTAFTELADNIQLRSDRPGLLVSSTSWTEDEDFSILFDALANYEESCQARVDSSNLPSLVCVITGKGPMKAHYAKLISRQNWLHVRVVMPWLEPEDYPQLLACADLGVSLHTSSSGLDLPMKVVDMFGCGLPVAAMDFPALPELVRDGQNGMVFSEAGQLSGQIGEWFRGFPTSEVGRRKRNTFVENLKQFQAVRWTEYWRKTALPVLEEITA